MKLEDFIKENKDTFNNEFPQNGHLERFETRLYIHQPAKNKFSYIKYIAISSAAVITLLIGISFVISHIGNQQNHQIKIAKQVPQQTVNHIKIPTKTSIELENKICTNHKNTKKMSKEKSVTTTPFHSQKKGIIKNTADHLKEVETFYNNKLDYEISVLEQLIANEKETNRSDIQHDIEHIKQTSVLPDDLNILSEEEQIAVISQVYTTQIESIQRMQNNFKQISFYQ